jgi:hypothetical protein
MKLGGVELSPYSLRARLRPVLFVALPIGLGVAAWFPSEVQGWGWLAGVATACGLTYFFAETAADAGRSKQQRLWNVWGGSPTTIHLRHRTSPLNPHTLARYHEKLRTLCPHLRIPTPEEEQADPEGADAVYESCVDFLREATRNSSAFPMVFSDNVNYGYRRNLWAIKPVGVATSILGIVTCGARIIQQWRTGGAAYTVAAACGVACLVLLGVFLFLVTERWVKRAGYSYALRILAALEKL